MTDRERIEEWLAGWPQLMAPRIVRAALAIIDAEHAKPIDRAGCWCDQNDPPQWPCPIAVEHEAKLWQAINGLHA